MTPQEETDGEAEAILAALAARGITPEVAYLEDARARVWPRFQRAYDRAMENGYASLAQRLESTVDQEVQRLVRRKMGGAQEAQPPSAPTRPATNTPAPPLPVGGYNPLDLPGRGPAIGRMGGNSPDQGAIAPPMPQTLTGRESVPQPPPTPTRDAVEATRLDWTDPSVRQSIPGTFQPPSEAPITDAVMSPDSPMRGPVATTENILRSMARESTGIPSAQRSGEAFAKGDLAAGAGNAALAIMPYKPVAGLAGLGATYAGALGADLGLFDAPQASAQQGPAQSNPMAADREMLKGMVNQQSLLRAQAEAARQRMEVERASGRGPRFNAAKQEYDTANARASAMDTQVADLNKRLSPENIQKHDEYRRAVENAERIKAEWEARDIQWNDTKVGKLNEAMGGYGPMLLGAVGGGLTRSTGRVMGHGDSFTSHYAAPAIMGGFLGGSAVNAPVIYNANQPEVLNPRRRALEEYAAALPPNHPRRAEAETRAAAMPELNPIRREANEQLGVVPTIRRTLSGALLEGAPGGVMGSEIVRRLGNRRTGGTTGDTGGGGGGNPPPPLYPPLAERRAQSGPEPGGHWVPPGAPSAIGEVETWASPAGREIVTRRSNGTWSQPGRRGSAKPPDERRGWRRISSGETNYLESLV